MGRWKGVRLNVRSDPSPSLELYDLDEDIGETTNIAAANPAIVSEIEQLMDEAHTYSPYFPLLYDE
jgi:arylsulfatase A